MSFAVALRAPFFVRTRFSQITDVICLTRRETQFVPAKSR